MRVLQWLLVNLELADGGQTIDCGSTLPAGRQRGEHTHRHKKRASALIKFTGVKAVITNANPSPPSCHSCSCLSQVHEGQL